MAQTKNKGNRLENAYSNTIKGVDITGNVGMIIPTKQKPTVQAPSTTSTPTSTPTPTPTQTTTNLKSTYGGVKGLDEYKNLVNQKTSALSSLNQANQLAMKYADNTALAQGYATQGAMLQNNANLQSAYINQAGGINQNFQNQLGALEDKNVRTNFDNLSTQIANQLQAGTLTEDSGNALLQAYSSQLPQEQLDQAKQVLNDALAMQNKESTDTLKSQESELTNNVINNFGGISPEHQAIIDKVGKGEITATQAIQQIYQTDANNNEKYEDVYGVNFTDDKGVAVDAISNYSYGTSTSSIFGKKHGSIADMTGLQYLINKNMLKEGDTVKLGKNVVILINGKFYKADKNINPTYIAYDYRQWQN